MRKTWKIDGVNVGQKLQRRAQLCSVKIGTPETWIIQQKAFPQTLNMYCLLTYAPEN